MTSQLYNDAILAEAKARPRPRPAAAPEPSRVTCDNPLCGDRVTVDLRIGGPAGRRASRSTPAAAS